MLLARALASTAARWPLLTYATAWTALLTLTVAVASFAPEVAFVAALSPASSFSSACDPNAFIRVPLDVPAEILCMPTVRFVKSGLDLAVPPVFAAVIVACAAVLVRAVGLWELDDRS